MVKMNLERVIRTPIEKPRHRSYTECERWSQGYGGCRKPDKQEICNQSHYLTAKQNFDTWVKINRIWSEFSTNHFSIHTTSAVTKSSSFLKFSLRFSNSAAVCRSKTHFFTVSVINLSYWKEWTWQQQLEQLAFKMNH